MAERKQKQILVLAGVGTLVLLLVTILAWLLNSDPSTAPAPQRDRANAVDTTLIANRTSGATPENDWVEQARQRLTRTEEMVNELSEQLKGQSNENQAQLNAKAEELRVLSEGYDNLIAEQARRIEELEAQVVNGIGTNTGNAADLPNAGQANAGNTGNTTQGNGSFDVAQPANTQGGDFVSPVGSRRQQVASTQHAEATPRNTSFSQRFDLKPREDARTSNVKTYQLDAYLPTGSYAPAIVIAGVDASVGVSNQAEPKPVLFRITGPATTAGFGGLNGAQIDLTGCMVAGAAVGDISSERVHVRLTSMTCQNRDRTVFETTVAGHMVSAGKAGLRGDVVSREGPAIRAAAMAGVLEGIAGAGTNSNSNVLSSLTSDDSTNVGAITQNAGRQALTGGVQNAASSLAQYYISRAEQYQPVISVYAGSTVELVFMEGVHLQ